MNEQLKPVAWIEESKIELLHESGVATVYEEKQKGVLLADPRMTPLYAIPDTHRVVSVGLLKSYQAAIEAGQFMGFDEEYDQMQAIIDNKREA